MVVYKLLASDSTGEYLCHSKDGTFELRPHCDDSCVWQWEESSKRLTNAVTGISLVVQPSSDAASYDKLKTTAAAAEIDALFGTGASLLIPEKCRLAGLPHEFGRDNLYTVRDAPTRLPSELLAELGSQGWTVVDNVMSRAMLSNLFANINTVREANAKKEAELRAKQDSRPYSSNDNVIRPSQLGGVSFLAKTPVVAQAAMNPVALWVIENYLGVDSIHYCQTPSIGGLRPAEKTGESAQVKPGGWHSDYPYPLTQQTMAHTFMLGPEEFEKLDASISSRGFPEWRNRQTRLGMQFNIALTDFTPENGATQFIFGSHEWGEAVPAELNAVPTVAGVGVHKDAVQMSFPAGSGILYDSRTWHRAPPELNLSGKERWAMLMCIVPSFVRDLRARDDKVKSADAFAQSTAVHSALTPREVKDVIRMLGDDEHGNPRPEIEAACAVVSPQEQDAAALQRRAAL